MKKLTTIILIAIMIMQIAVMTSCGDSKNYKVLEADGFDNVVGANHTTDIELETEDYQRLLLSNEKDIHVNGQSIIGEYKRSRKNYLYKSNLDYFSAENDGEYFEIGVNQDTDRIDRYSWVDMNYVSEKCNSEILSEAECLGIAKDYLSQYVDVNEYVVEGIKYLEIPEYQAIYDVRMVRVIDGVKTSDNAAIGVSVFGDVVSHTFVSLGEMKNATVPTQSDRKTIRNLLDEKVGEIYREVSEKYTWTYEIDEETFIRLDNGKYSLEYYITVQLKDPATMKELVEVVKLLVLV